MFKKGKKVIKVLQYKVLVIGLLSLGISVVCLIVIELCLGDTAFRRAPEHILSGIITASCVGLVFDFLTRSELMDVLLEKVGLSYEIVSTGLNGIRRTRKYIDVNKAVKGCTGSLDILAMTGRQPIIEELQKEIYRLITEEGVVVRILLCRELGCLKIREGEEHMREGRLNGEVQDVLHTCKNIIEDVKREKAGPSGKKMRCGKLIVAEYESIPLCSLYIVDKKYAFYSPYLYKVPGAESPTYEFHKSSADEDVFPLLSNCFKALWGSTKPVVEWPESPRPATQK